MLTHPAISSTSNRVVGSGWTAWVCEIAKRVVLEGAGLDACCVRGGHGVTVDVGEGIDLLGVEPKHYSEVVIIIHSGSFHLTPYHWGQLFR